MTPMPDTSELYMTRDHITLYLTSLSFLKRVNYIERPEPLSWRTHHNQTLQMHTQ
jgi:hypothetical protein